MPKAPVADQLQLLTVQDLDTKLAQARHRLGNLPARQELEEVTRRGGRRLRRRA